MRHTGCVLDRAWTDIEFFISYPDSQLCMATDSSRRWHFINYLGGKFATYSNHWPCFDTQLVVDLFQCECLLLAVSHTTLKCPGRRIPRVEARVGEFLGSKVLGICNKIPPLQMCSSTCFNCVVN